MPDSFLQILAEIRQIYQEIDQQISFFQKAIQLHCPAGCSICCEGREVEATVPELLLLADELFLSSQHNSMAELIEQKEKSNDRICVLYRPDPLIPGNGRCGQYPVRPLVCRLFGFTGRYNKSEEPEFSTCKKLSTLNPHKVSAAQELIRAGLNMPVYQASFMRLASLSPGLGFQRFPINQALKKALEYCFWKISF